jgi:hypothetical protein
MSFKVKSKKSKVKTKSKKLEIFTFSRFAGSRPISKCRAGNLNFCLLTFTFCLFIFFGQSFADQPPRYEIDATLDTITHKISAKQKVVFTNNSKQELSEVYFHIYPHRKYTKKEIRFIYRYAGYFKTNPFPEGFQSGDLKIDSVSSRNKTLDFTIEGDDRTILKVNLDYGLKPAESIEIEINFGVDIPHSYGRFGWHRDIISLNRWYPLLSVLDKDGWHSYPFYIYHHPYFSDAAYYKVRLTLPQPEIVAATGILKEERLNPDGTKTLALETELPTRDFALGICRNYLIFSIQDKHVKINSYYLKGDEKRAQKAAEDAQDLIKFHAQRFGEYPYKEFNIVPNYLGYGGDQSSCLVFIDTRVYRLPSFLERYFDFFISHETGHQWFYNIVGSDEYREMFLDEGMNSYWLLRYLEDKYGLNAEIMVLPKFLKPFIPNFSFRDSTALRYIYMAQNGLDRPVIGELSSFHEPSSIFALTYSKGAGILEMLESYLGARVFDKIIRRYTQEFRFKNVSLDDFIRISNEESGRDLNWFFQQWLKTAKTCDYAVKKVSSEKIILENRGTIQMSVETKITYRDGTQATETWDGKDKYYNIPVKNKKVKRVELDPENRIGLDLDRTNNYWPRNLYFKPVPLYFFAYEIPVFLPRNSYNVVAGPRIGGSALGIGASGQKPYDGILRINSVYDFNGRAVDSRIGYEFPHLFNKQTTLGFEIFDYESSKAKNDLSGGKIYLRKELWPASYGVFDSNDHLTLYLIRDQKLDTTTNLGTKEEMKNLHYRRKSEAILGITGTFGRYGPYADPDYGWKFIPTQEFAGHFLGGNESFWRSSAELNNYQLILPRYQHKVASKVKFGWGESSDKKLFQLGGPDGLRGYNMKTIEGTHAVLGSLEYRLPLFIGLKLYFADNLFCLDKIQGVAFFDVGKSWNSSFHGADFKKDAGVGLRFHFDLVGFLEKIVLKVDFAQAINEPKEDLHVWFGISQAF